VIQSTLKEASKGHTLAHSKSYSFGMMSVDNDEHPEYDFGASDYLEEEFQDIIGLITQFKSFKPNSRKKQNICK
jgi:hypothetical protein